MKNETNHKQEVLRLHPEFTARYGAGFTWEIRDVGQRIMANGKTVDEAWYDAYRKFVEKAHTAIHSGAVGAQSHQHA